MGKKRALKTYNIPVVWHSWGLITVEAETLDEAIAEATAPTTPLPATAEFIDGSLEVDHDGIPMHNELTEEELS